MTAVVAREGLPQVVSRPHRPLHLLAVEAGVPEQVVERSGEDPVGEDRAGRHEGDLYGRVAGVSRVHDRFGRDLRLEDRRHWLRRLVEQVSTHVELRGVHGRQIHLADGDAAVLMQQLAT